IDRQYLLVTPVADNRHSLQVYELHTGRRVAAIADFDAIAEECSLLGDGKHLLARTETETSLWSLPTGKRVARLFFFGDGTWVVMAPDGRFDTNRPERAIPLHWVLPERPLHPLPLEVLMRDYYEPRLLSRILAGERFRAVRPQTS